MPEISKKICEILSAWCLLTLLALAPNFALSACNLPVPDMGGADVSPPNYTGYLKSTGGGVDCCQRLYKPKCEAYWYF